MIGFKDLKRGDLYKVTFSFERYTGYYDNALSPRVRIIEGRGNYFVALFRGFTIDVLYKGTPIWDVVAAPMKFEGSPEIAWGYIKK